MAPLVCSSGLTGFLSIAAKAVMRERLEGRTASGFRSEPSKIAGVIGQPQSLERGGPELRGARGMSPSRTLKPGKLGFEASG